MTPEASYLLLLLKDALSPIEDFPPLPEELLPALFEFSSAQHLAHIASEQLYQHRLLENAPKWKRKFELNQQILLTQDIRMDCDAANLYAICEAEQIDYMPLKGAVLKSLYPREHMRTGSDIDVLFRREDIDRLVEVLPRSGYTVGEQSSHEVEVTSPAGATIEAHFCLFEYDKEISSALEKVWDTAVLKEGTGHHYLMTPENFYFYHIAHLFKHFMFGGYGIRAFLDLYLMNLKMPADQGKLLGLMDQCGLKTFYLTCLKLSQVWFGDETHDEATELMQNFILSAGIFGKYENYIAVRQSQTSSRFAASLSRLFLKREVLENQYPNLRKHPWLLPFYRVKRWSEIGLSGGLSRFKSWQQSNRDSNPEAVDQTKVMLEKLDLLNKKI